MRGSDKRKAGSEEQKDIHDLAFLSKTAVGFLELSPDDDIYQFIGEQLKKLAGDSVIFVNSFDSATDKASVRTALGLGKKAEAIAKMLGRHPVGTSLSINEEARIGLSSGKLKKVPGGLYEFSFRRIPKAICHAIEKLLDLGNIYAMGFTWKGELFGSTSILTRKGTKLRNQTLIEAFIKQASVALQRRQAEEALQKAREQLELRVKERTKELAQANKQLRAEIAERKQAEEALRQSEEKLRLMFESATDGIVVTDRNGNIMEVNEAAVRLYGPDSKEKLIGRSAFEFIAEKDRVQVMEVLKSALEDGQIRRNVEITFLTEDGREYFAEVSSALLKDASGNPVGFIAITRDITERKQTEEKIKQTAEEWGTTFDSITDLIFIQDKDFRLIRVNKAFADAVKMEPEELIGKHCYEIVHGTNEPVSNCPAKKTIETKKPTMAEFFEPHLGIHLEISASPRFNEKGVIVGTVHIAKDITERKRAEEVLRESEEHLHTVVSNAPVVLWALDKEGIFTLSEGAGLKVLGLRPGEVVGQSVFDVYRDVPKILKNNRRALSGETIVSIVKVGELVYESLYSPTRDKNGEVIGMIGVSTDITERKRAEEELRKSEERYRDLLENANDLIQSVTPDGRFLYVNRAWQNTLRYTQEEIGGLSLFDIIHPDSQAHCTEVFQRVISGENVDRTEAIFVTKGGEKITVEGSVSCRFVDGKPVATRGIFRNVTERKKMEKRLSKLYEAEKRHRKELEEEKRVRGRSINVLAHELRTPLTPLLASATLLKDILPPGKECPEHELTNLIISGAETLATRLDELLDLARYTVGAFTINPQPLDIQAVLKKAAEQHRELVKEKKQSIILDLPQRLPSVSGDRLRLEQVLTNLLSNATKFSPEGSSITIRARAKGSKVMIEVEDRGGGLSPEEQERIFQPYHRVEQDRQRFTGLGLGLAICKQIVEAHRGEIWVKSRVGHGSKFTFTLPAIRRKATK